jgi:hypothetical protein
MTDQEPGNEQSARPAEWDLLQCLNRIDRHIDKALDLMMKAGHELDDVLFEIDKIQNR